MADTTTQTVTTIRSFRDANLAQEFDGALIRAYSRRLATVVTVGGSVTVDNLDRVTARVLRHVLDDSVVLDLGGIDGLDSRCGALVDEVRTACEAVGVEFAVVATDEVADALNVDDGVCAVTRSVPEALRYFADVSCARQRVLLPLLGRIA